MKSAYTTRLRKAFKWLGVSAAVLLAIGAIALAIVGIPRPAAIRAEGVGRVPWKPAREVASAFLLRRSESVLGWHSTERRLFTNRTAWLRPQLHLLDRPGEPSRKITNVTESWSLAAVPYHRADFIVMAMDRGGNEYHQLYLLRLADGSLQPITNDKSQNLAGGFQPGGNLLAFASTLRNGEDRDIYVIDPEKPETRRMVAEMKGYWTAGKWAPDNRRLLARQHVSADDSRIHVVDTQTGIHQSLFPADAPKGAYTSPEWGPGGTSVYFVSNAGSEYSNIRVVDLATHQIRLVAGFPDRDVETIEASADGRRLLALVNEDGVFRPYQVDPVTGGAQPIPGVPPGSVTNLVLHPRLPEVALTHTTLQAEVSIVSVHLDTGELTTWVRPSFKSEFPPPIKIVYPTFDQVNGERRKIPSWLLEPHTPARQRSPVLIQIHGGPEMQSSPIITPPDEVTLSSGVAVLKPNVRGSSGYGRTYLNLDNGYLREDSVRDIGALLDWIATQPHLDPDRVAVIGGSYGGYMALAAAVHYSSRLRCSVDMYGISNFVTYLEKTEDYRRDVRRIEYGDERDPRMRSFLASIAPIRHVERITIPMFIYQGKNDARVPVHESRQMVEALRRLGRTVWYIEADNEGHGLTQPANLIYTGALFSKFLQACLLKD